VALLNRLYERITRVVDDSKEWIDKFLGDAVLCIFDGRGTPLKGLWLGGVNHAGGVESSTPEAADPPIKRLKSASVSITGPVVLGTIRTRDRMDLPFWAWPSFSQRRLEEVTKVPDRNTSMMPTAPTSPSRDSLGEFLIGDRAPSELSPATLICDEQYPRPMTLVTVFEPLG